MSYFLSRKHLDPYPELSTVAKVSNIFWPPAGDLSFKELRVVKQAKQLNVHCFGGRCADLQQKHSPTLS